jgi:vacuolar-type H+-ATPase subunit H
VDENSGAPAPEGALAELIETERRIETEVAEAVATAERLVESARAEARSVAEDAVGLDEELRALRDSIDRECAETVRASEARAAAAAEGYRRVSEAEVGRLGKWVVSRLLGSASGP